MIDKLRAVVNGGWGKSAWLDSITEIAKNPMNPDVYLKVAKAGLEAVKCINRNNEQLKKFEDDAASMRREGDRLEAMVHANWQGIKKCNSEDEYLLEEEKIAQALEEEMLKSQQQKRIGS